MTRKLVVLSGPAKGQVLALRPGVTLKIGRGQTSDIRLDDPRISRVHCSIEVAPQGLIVTDAGSTGGTYVAGGRITSHLLGVGDEFQIGETRIRFEVTNAASHGPANKAPVPVSGKSLTDLSGQVLGHFKLARIIHTGSAGVLFLAEDQQQNCPAAVKVMIPTAASDEEQRSRFVRAVHTMINVRHNNLVEVYGAGKQGPFCWCAMEYVDGISIREMIELVGIQGRLDWRDVYRVGVHVARALECAHRHKVIHRNVTPENLLQRKNDKVVKLCDLMLAKALEGTQARQVTVPGQLVGDVAYMSPERIADTSKLDWRSDQYGLGATLFALLTGHPPFQSATLSELVKQIRTATPQFSVEVGQDANHDFLNSILKMLAKSPEGRFTFPSELLGCLNEIGRDSNVDADMLYNG